MFQRIAHLSTRAALLLSATLLVAVAVGDFATHAVTAGLFYLIPVVIATVGAGGVAGVVFAVASSLIWLAANPSTDDIRFVLGSQSIAALRFCILLFAVLVVSELRRATSREAEMARRDALSGLSNRRRLFELAEVEVARARRTGEPLSVAYFDVDDFKLINDRFGHATGDELIKVMGHTLSDSSREVDVAARLGETSSSYLLPNTDTVGAEVVLSKVRERFLSEVRTHGWPVGLSAGAVSFDRPPRSAEEMVTRADEMLLQAKRDRDPSRTRARHVSP